MTVKFNDGDPVYICDECRVIICRASKPYYGSASYCTECGEKLIEAAGGRHRPGGGTRNVE